MRVYVLYIDDLGKTLYFTKFGEKGFSLSTDIKQSITFKTKKEAENKRIHALKTLFVFSIKIKKISYRNI